MKKFKLIFTVFFLLIFFSLILIQIWSEVAKLGFSISSVIYWMLFIGWIGFIKNFNLGSKISLSLGFAMFFASSILVIFGGLRIGEIVMRLSLIFWLVGITHAIVEYRAEKI